MSQNKAEQGEQEPISSTEGNRRERHENRQIEIGIQGRCTRSGAQCTGRDNVWECNALQCFAMLYSVSNKTDDIE
jgi:hypothetical protein